LITNSQDVPVPGHAAQRDGQHDDDHAHADSAPSAHDDGGDDRRPAPSNTCHWWPFASQQEADRWLRDDAPYGHLPWHAEEDTTALYFTQNYLGFTEINQTTNVTTKGMKHGQRRV